MEKKEQIIEKIKTIYPKDAEKVLTAMQGDIKTVFRVNTLKASHDVLDRLIYQGFVFDSHRLANVYVLQHSEQKKTLTETAEFQKGEIYIQGLSSIECVNVLHPRHNETILDLCAAPGSKTSYIAQLTENNAKILAVEKNKTRYQKLMANLERLGTKNIDVMNVDGYELSKQRREFDNYFDKVLVDAPCSNEGYIQLNEPKTYAFWNKRKFTDLTWQQKGLLFSGFTMLKPGGTLLYATCTFSVEENEEVVHQFLKKHTNAYVLPVTLSKGTVTVDGFTHWKSKAYDPSLVNTKRILPDTIHKAFYIALITKTD